MRSRCSSPRARPSSTPRSSKQAQDNLASLEHELSDEQLQRLTAAAPISLGFPHSFLASQHVTELIFGETRPLIDA